MAFVTKKHHIRQKSMILGDHDVLKVPFLMQTAGTFQPDILLDMIEVHEVVEIQIHLEIHNKKVEVLYWNTSRFNCY